MINVSISTNILIMISLVILFIIIAIIAYIIYKDRKIDQEEIDNLLDDIVKAKPREDEIKVTKIETKNNDKIDLESMLETMQANLDNKKMNNVDAYEKDQEENAIISIKELEKTRNKIEAYEKDQEENAKINYNEINKSAFDNLIELEEELVKPVKRSKSKKKFQNTDFISPIYGKMEEHMTYPKISAYKRDSDLDFNEYFGKDVSSNLRQLEQTLNLEPLRNEITKNDEFLRALKEFRNNL